MIIFPANLSADKIDRFYDETARSLQSKTSEPVEIDCSRIERVTSSHINVLWQARIQCTAVGSDLALISPSADLIRVLRALDLYEIFIPRQSCPAETDSVSEKPGPFEPGQAFDLRFKPDVRSIDSALTAFRDFLEQIEIVGTPAFELETAFYEVATNIRVHGQLANDDTVEFTAECLPDRLSMKFIDPGRPFNYESLNSEFDPEQAMTEGRKRGFGLIMISRMTDNVRYERRDKRYNVLTVEKTWSRANG
jgi:anti-sigma regulatory factor (Ser/Thr protein kinase)/anti-anti-sigma regulatory factor